MDSLRGRWKLKELLAAVGMAKSSYEYAANALKRPETEKERAVREAVVRAFEDNGGTYGYRRLLPEVNDAPGIKVGEWTVRKIMKERDLVACAPQKKRRYSSYVGEVSEAPENTCLDEKGRHHFSADKPNELWITDITEFRIPAGKCYLSRNRCGLYRTRQEEVAVVGRHGDGATRRRDGPKPRLRWP